MPGQHQPQGTELSRFRCQVDGRTVVELLVFGLGEEIVGLQRSNLDCKELNAVRKRGMAPGFGSFDTCCAVG